MRPAFRIALNRQRGNRRIISAILLAAFAVTATGIPLPIGAPRKKPDWSFPCASSSCGCASAEQCWRSCCCHSLAERLSWARSKGVRPPEFAIALARDAGNQLTWLEDSHEKLAHHPKSCCDENRAPVAQSCGARGDCEASTKVVRSCCTTADHAEQSRTVNAWQSLKCSGLSMNWLAAVPTMIDVQIEFTFELAPTIWLRHPASDCAHGTSDLPAVPPPERA